MKPRPKSRTTYRTSAAALGALVVLGVSACSSDTKSLATTLSSEGVPVATDTEERLGVAEFALQQGDFSLMAEALDLSSVADEVNQRATTILAPADQAFAALDKDTYGDLLTNPTKLDDVVKRHVLDGAFSYEQLGAMTEVNTIGGETLTVKKSDNVLTVAGAEVTPPADPTLAGTNGQEFVVLGVDRVILEAA